ncbi:hypothetical protein SUGI_0917850 [Cryptomeria japonica]|uniref:uncharacterized protein LOC131061911 n=1 Tax=Cryptomeria japonica TaxID=3369 RepID=UPI002414A0E5|nr:uncharacterized protein LOC131061911 [Cryptomeria japonica]GLJ44021.1 hypothetical protein SUGI_0917850 [Cryptomeria japonica]
MQSLVGYPCAGASAGLRSKCNNGVKAGPRLVSGHGGCPAQQQQRFGGLQRKKTPFDLHRRVWGPKQAWLSALQALEHPKDTQWVLQPTGDGRSEHLNTELAAPSAFSVGDVGIVQDVTTIGRVAGRVDVVIPIATVSGVHARLERIEGNLFVTDLGSTNGTYIDNNRIKAWTLSPLSPGNRLTFGDHHLATFYISQST